mmetsp:Transcript_15905/g.31916  ORF Transcript_15905/g.31916 Transcript_15905/m.31916 type:complete len:205 (-) Transcript_15905:2410-3024(-)
MLLLVMFELLGSTAASFALQFDLAAGGELCFFEELVPGEQVDASFSVLRGGNRMIAVHVSDPRGSEVYVSDHEGDGIVQFGATDPGTHFICFSNRRSMVGHKVVNIQMRTEAPLNISSIALRSTLERSDQQLEVLDRLVRNIEFKQTYIAQLWKRHMAILDETRMRAYFCACLQVLVAFLLSIAHHLMMRSVVRRRSIRAPLPV